MYSHTFKCHLYAFPVCLWSHDHCKAFSWWVFKKYTIVKNQISPSQCWQANAVIEVFPWLQQERFYDRFFFKSLDGWLVKSIECAAWGFYSSVCKWLKELLTHLQKLIRSCLTAEILLSFQSLNAVSQSFPQCCKCRTGGNAAFCAYMQSYLIGCYSIFSS